MLAPAAGKDASPYASSAAAEPESLGTPASNSSTPSRAAPIVPDASDGGQADGRSHEVQEEDEDEDDEEGKEILELGQELARRMGP